MVTKVHNRMIEGSMVNVQDFGASLDGSTDDAAAWALADAKATATGSAIYIPASTGGMAIASAIQTLNSIVMAPGAFILYTGSSDIAALTVGATNTVSVSKHNFQNLDVRRNVQSDWTSENNIGIRLLNLNACMVDIHNIVGFTIGLQTEGNDAGYQNNYHVIRTLQSNKVGLNVLSAEDITTLGFNNENTYRLGRITVSTGINTTLSRWGIRLDTTKVTPQPPNSNLFIKPNFEMNAADTTGTARAVLITYGYYNKFDHCRDEGNDLDGFMECDNDAEWNRATVTTNVAPLVLNNGLYDSNFVVAERQYPLQRQNSSWQSPCLPRVANEFNGAGEVYVPGCSFRNSSNGNQHISSVSATLVTVADDYLDINGARGIGVMVDTGNIKRFIFRRDVETGRGGRIVVIPYDANAAQLTTDGSYVRATSAATMSHSSQVGGSYITGTDSGTDLFFSVSSSVHFIWVGYFGSGVTARVRSFAIESVDGGALSVFQGYLDVNSDPFPNDLVNYATAAPVTAAAGPNYPAGKRLHKFNHSTGISPGWVCITQGLGGTAAFEAEGVTS